jgi:hypothetical protein
MKSSSFGRTKSEAKGEYRAPDVVNENKPIDKDDGSSAWGPTKQLYFKSRSILPSRKHIASFPNKKGSEVNVGRFPIEGERDQVGTVLFSLFEQVCCGLGARNRVPGGY